MTESRLGILGGHAICVDPSKPCDDSSWIGGFPGEGRFYCQHLERALQDLKNKDISTLVLSGGATRREAGMLSEARSLAYLAVSLGHSLSKIILEEYAMDSLDNNHFSLAAYRREFEAWPDHVTCYGWDFKKSRYEHHCCVALRWPTSGFKYVAVNTPEDLDQAKKGEQRKLNAIEHDPFLKGKEWQEQRAKRNWTCVPHPYGNVSELAPYFMFLTTPEMEFVGKFPWES